MKENKRLKAFYIAASVLFCAWMSGCSGSNVASKVSFTAESFSKPDTVTELTLTLEEGETELLSAFTALQSADFSGSGCVEEIFAWAQEHPEVDVKYTVALPDGSTVDNACKAVDLSAVSGSDAAAAADVLRYLPKLRTIELGSERSGLDLDAVASIHAACPEAKIKYDFTLYGKQFEFNNMRINLSHIPVGDGGAALMKAMDCMPELCYVDMDSCGVPNEEMAAIRDRYPDIKVVWRIWFGDNYSVRTEAERILASKPSAGGMLTADNTQDLKYCTDVRFLDVGHNEALSDISFVASMPKLEVAVFAMTCITDLSPLRNCPELEYLELQTSPVSDLTPLAGLVKLHHLNVCMTEVNDISPLYGMKELERLWLGGYVHIPQEQLDTMHAAAPACEINTTAGDPTEGHWRYENYEDGIYNFRYTMLRLQFGYENEDFSLSWNDPLY